MRVFDIVYARNFLGFRILHEILKVCDANGPQLWVKRIQKTCKQVGFCVLTIFLFTDDIREDDTLHCNSVKVQSNVQSYP